MADEIRNGDSKASVCADFLVELRGFEPLTSAVQPPRRASEAAPV
jgi:hypothetical protein